MTEVPYHIPEYTKKALKMFDNDASDEDIQYIIDHTYGVSTLFIDDEPAMTACIFELKGDLIFTGAATWRGPKCYAIALHYAERLLSSVKNRDVFCITEPDNLPVLLTLGKLKFMIVKVTSDDVILVRQRQNNGRMSDGQFA